MNPQYPITDEILSAFLDGELPEDERKQVEDWLESSPEARQQLEDLRQIGSLVRSIPRPAVPQGFHPSIMLRVQEAAAQGKGQFPPNAASPSVNGKLQAASKEGAHAKETAKRWASGLVSLVAVMGLILAVGLFLQNQQARNDVAGNLDRDNSQPMSEVSLETGEAAEGESFGAGAIGGGGVGSSFDNEPAPPMPAPASASGGSRGGDDEMAPPEALPQMVDPSTAVADAAVFPPNGMTLQEWIDSRPDPANPPTPGEIGDFLIQVGGQAVLVEFVCVDVSAVDHTSNQLQVLLTANNIRPLSAYSEPIDPESIRFEQGEQVVIYVEADEETIATTFTQMSELEGVLDMHINNSVGYSVADGNVRDRAHEGFNTLSQEYGGATLVAPGNPGSGADAPRAQSGQDATPDNEPSQDVVPSDPSGAEEPQRSVEDGAMRALNNFQITQSVSPDVVNGLELQSRSPVGVQRMASNVDRQMQQPMEAQPAEAESTDGATPEEGAMEVAEMPALPVQLIFVVRPQGPLPASEAQ